MIYNKLVRDKIPEIIAKQGKSVSFRALKGNELKKALKDKLIEEAQELFNAKSDVDIIEETADVLEVLHSLLREYNLCMETAQERRLHKYKSKGAFLYGYFLESVGEGNDTDPTD